MVYRTDDMIITTEKMGARQYAKVSYPIRYGLYHEVKTRDYLFQLNLHGEVKYVSGRLDWPNPAEWLKRSPGNDWTYYSSGDYNGIVERFGEYYFPCFPYASNSIMADEPFTYGAVQRALAAAAVLPERLARAARTGAPPEIARFCEAAAACDAKRLARRERQFHALIGGRVSVLPPDARHADYEVAPVILADGCLYNCRFCSVKSGQGLSLRPKANILAQVEGLKSFLGPDARNYNALFLGQHDALAAGADLIEATAEAAYETLDFEHSLMGRPALFLFGSVDSFLRAQDGLFASLNGTPFSTYINLGLESADGATLQLLGKPVSEEAVRDAFARMGDINRRCERVEVTANFVIGLDLPRRHLASLLGLAGSRPQSGKESIYISPIVPGGAMGREEKRALLGQFDTIKAECSLPAYLYLIQRL
jgi:hypothetical protein